MKWIPMIILGLSLSGCCCCGGGGQATVRDVNGTIVVTDTLNQDKLQLLKFEDKADGFSHYIVGEVKNVSNSPISYAYISFSLKDKDGKVLGSTCDLLSTTLQQGEVWKFKCMIVDENTASYSLAELR